MLKKFETFTFGDLDDYVKNDLEDDLSYYQGEYEFSEDLEEDMKEIAENAIDYFNTKLPIFKNIHVQFVEKLHSDTLGMYIHESVLKTPVILISRKAMKECEEDYGLDLVIRTTIFHELGHAIADLDNQFVWIENENILNFDDEEVFAEDFAFNIDMFGEIPEDVEKLMDYYKNHKTLGVE